MQPKTIYPTSFSYDIIEIIHDCFYLDNVIRTIYRQISQENLLNNAFYRDYVLTVCLKRG